MHTSISTHQGNIINLSENIEYEPVFLKTFLVGVVYGREVSFGGTYEGSKKRLEYKLSMSFTLDIMGFWKDFDKKDLNFESRNTSKSSWLSA